jgi:hypothetical protein
MEFTETESMWINVLGKRPKHWYKDRETGLTIAQRRGMENAKEKWAQTGGKEKFCVGDSPSGLTGTRRSVLLKRRTCTNLPGAGTKHSGFGRCRECGGMTPVGYAEGVWIMAHRYAQELDVSPWEALLKCVRIAAGRVAYCEWVLGTATSDLEIEGRVRDTEGNVFAVHPDTGEPIGVGKLRDLTFWRDQSERWIDRLAKFSTAAIAQGVAAALIERERVQADRIVKIFTNVLDDLSTAGMSEELQMQARRSLRLALLAEDARDQTTQAQLHALSSPDAAPEWG